MPTDPAAFDAELSAAFAFPHPSLDLGRAVLGAGVRASVPARLPLSMANRHGLVAGATGTGKTKTLQVMAEQFAAAGVPVFVADVKGDLAGLARPGEPSPRLNERMQSMAMPWEPWAPTSRLWSLTGANGAQLRSSVASFGPLLLSRILELNATQSGVLSLLFKLCDDAGLLLLDLSDLRAALTWVTSPEAAEQVAQYGGVSKATTGVILRKLVALEAQGADLFFGEPELDLADFLQLDADGHGVVNVLDLTDVQRQPKLFSTAMLWLLAELYETLPERGDADRPVLAFFFDEAHLLFDDAPKALLAQIEQVARLIRSKGVSVWFVTQSPADIPEAVLGQLGSRIQHALRAFTPKDRKSIRLTAQNFPESAHYDIEAALTQVGTGEALVSLLGPRGAPSPTLVTRVPAPRSRMGVLTAAERELLLFGADYVERYKERVDRESARELLEAATRPQPTAPPPAAAPSTWDDPFGRWGAPPPQRPVPQVRRAPPAKKRAPARRPASGGNDFLDLLNSSAGKTLQKEIVRGVFGLLKRR